MNTLWACAIALSTFLYVLLDGFDLGVGMLSAFATRDDMRRDMMAAIGPVWDGNETWLVVTGTILFGAFPPVYATLLSAFYLPIIGMIIALIFRGVAFEFRERSAWSRPFWDRGFSLGSLVATFLQGVVIGAIIRGVPMTAGHFSGPMFFWWSEFSVLCGIGLCVGYTLLGACWLAGKVSAKVDETAFRSIPWLMLVMTLFVMAAFAISVTTHLQMMNRWSERPYLMAFPAIALIGIGGLLHGVRHRAFAALFPAASLVFVAALATLAASFWPYMIPFTITIDAAAAPASSLRFLFWGIGVFVFPLTLVYTGVVYRIFKGPIQRSKEG